MITLGIVGIGTSIVLVSMCLCCFQMSRMRSEQNRRLRQILAASHTLSRCGTSKSTTTYASVDGLSTGRPGPWIPPLPDDLMPSFDTRLVCDPTTQHVRVCAADELTGARPLNVPIAGTSTFQPANTHAIPTLTMPASAAHDYESCVYDEALD